jgi:hypothetical protein
MTLLAATILPVTLVINQSRSGQRAHYIQSSRSILLNSLLNSVDPDDPQIAANFVNASMATISESGTTIPYIRQVDLTNSNAMVRRVYDYVYRTTSDSVSSPQFRVNQTFELDEYRIDCGLTSGGYRDNSGFSWVSDIAYNSGNKVPGFVSGATTGSVSSATDILNTTNDTLYRTYREGSPLSYSLDVPNGDYSVQLHFAELDATVGTASNLRRVDIVLEGSTVATNFSPRETCGSAANTACSVVYTVTVSDGVLNIVLNKSATSGASYNPRMAAIMVRRRNR